MNGKIRLSFMETAFITNPFDRCWQEVEKGFIPVRAFPPKKEPESGLFLFTQIDVNPNEEVDLAEILSKDKEGVKWLEKYKNHGYTGSYDKLPFLIETSDSFPIHYIAIPDNKEKRIASAESLSGTKVYPYGKIEKSLESGILCSLRGEDWLKDRASINNFRSDGRIWNHATRKIGFFERIFGPDIYNREKNAGVILGKVHEHEIVKPKGDFEGGFPYTHSAKIDWVISIREIGKYSPISIKIDYIPENNQPKIL